MRAAHTPVLSLLGSDLTALGESVDMLQSYTHRLADLQTTEADADAVRTDLYPISFLRSLITLEEARRAFAASGAQRDYNTYATLRTSALEEGKIALMRFRKAFDSYDTDGFLPALTLQGTITKEQTGHTLDAILAGFNGIEKEIAAESACMKGLFMYCVPFSIRAVTVPTPLPADESTLAEALSLYGSLVAPARAQPILGLDSSTCLANEKRVAYVRRTSPPERSGVWWYVGDIFYTPIITDPSAVVHAWFKEQQARYLPYNPLIFYTCPTAGTDIARSTALLTLAETLGMSAAGTPPVLYEHDILERLSTAIRTKKDSQTLRILYQMYADRSAGFELVAYDVAHGLKTILTMHEQRIPVDTSAAFLFLTHSAYYSLFGAYNETFRAGTPAPVTSQGSDRFFKTFKRYSETKGSVDSSALRHDIELFLKAHVGKL